MELPPTPEHDVLALPIRARLFEALAGLRKPATTQQLAVLVGRHPNTVRVQLRRMADAGLLECRRRAQRRGRPRHEWAILPSARPAGQPPQAYGELSRWLARAVGTSEQLPRIEHAGREIGRELAPQAEGRQLPEAMLDVLTSLGFAPRSEPHGPDGIRYVLGNCPYRDAVAESPAVVCTLHRGITTGLLDKLRPQAQLQASSPATPTLPAASSISRRSPNPGRQPEASVAPAFHGPQGKAHRSWYPSPQTH